MKKILKYTLPDYGTRAFAIKGAKVLGVAIQQGAIVFWAEVEELGYHPGFKTLQVVYTGDEVPDGKYIGTVMSYDGNIVSHVYELDFVK